MALKQRRWKAEGLIHHSDQGVQYASSDYTDILEKREIQISMSRRGNPYDNARAGTIYADAQRRGGARNRL